MPPLRHGHIHQHSYMQGLRITTVWPAPGNRWHVGVNSYQLRATTKPVTEEELGWLLREWGVEVDRWESWLDSHLWTMRNPFLWTSAGEAWLRRQQG